MADELDWRNNAFELYREGQLELHSWTDIHGDEIDYWIEELKEALLDLKEATIADEPARVMGCIQEVAALIFELRRRKQGD
jgi:hypothetical protein